MLVWLLLILACIAAAVLALWALLIGVFVVGGMASTSLCPRCGVSLGVTDNDRLVDAHIDPRYRSRSSNSCARCGWRSSDDR